MAELSKATSFLPLIKIKYPKIAKFPFKSKFYCLRRLLFVEKYNNPDWSPELGQHSGYGSTKKGPSR